MYAFNHPNLNFDKIFRYLCQYMKYAAPVRTERWQGVDVSKDPSAVTYELLNVEISVDLDPDDTLDDYADQIRPNIPWADDHFAERVCGSPLNPGTEWKNWPWANSADKFRKDMIFNHTYAERLWPKWAKYCRQRVDGVDYLGGKLPCPSPTVPARRQPWDAAYDESRKKMTGIGFEYGDLADLVLLLANEPTTRQAWIPLFFPEDTGLGDGGRKPCTLGYQFIVRNGAISIWYPLRSCDLVRHFRDDCYLAIRLLLWVLDRCREINPEFWNDIVPGNYSMHCTSLHVFENDMRKLREGKDV